MANGSAARQAMLDVDLLCYVQSILKLNTKVAYRTIDLSVAQQQLHSAQIAGRAVDFCGFYPAQRMRAGLHKLSWRISYA